MASGRLYTLHRRGQAAMGRRGWAEEFIASLYQVGLRAVVTGLMARRRFTFPARSIGPWWVHWGWRFEILMRWVEDESLSWCRALVRPGMTVVDIGAHIGYYTRLFSELVGPTGRVLCFEPCPENAPVLAANLRHPFYANAEIVELAASDRAGFVPLYVSPGSSNHSLVPGYTAAQGIVMVQSVSLDDFLHLRGVRRVDFLKVDVEGAEPLVLSGARETIARSPAMVMLVECNPPALRAGGWEPAGLVGLLQEFGLSVREIAPDGRLEAPQLQDFDRVRNLLCCKMRRER